MPRLLQEATKLVPGHAEYLACLSKQWSDITFIPGTPDAEAKSCAEKGIAFAEQVHTAFAQLSMKICRRSRTAFQAT